MAVRNLETISIVNVDSEFKVKNKVASDLTKAVTYLHNLNPPIIHSDINPTNVLISNSGLIVKLCDFGTARNSDYYQKPFNSKQIQFQSPEKFDDKNDKSRASDIWSLGCVLVFLYTGVYPFRTMICKLEKQKMAIIEENLKLKQLPQNLEHLPEPHQDIIAKCFTYDLKLRIDSLELMALIEKLEI